MDSETCQNCRFWDGEPNKEGRYGVGHCHRYPPKVAIFLINEFPETTFNDYCGEFKVKEPNP